MKSSKQLREEITALNDRVDAIVAVATEEQRDLTTEEQSEVDSIQGRDDNHGQVGDLTVQLKRVEKIEARQAALAASRVTVTPERTLATERVVPATARRHGKLRAFTDEFDAFSSGQFLRAVVGGSSKAREWCNSNGLQIRAVMGENDNEKGGYLVPSPMENAIIRLVEDHGVFRNNARNVPMDSDTLDVPRRSSGFTVYYPGEAGSITVSDLGFESVKLSATKMAILARLSTELSEDSAIQMADLLALEMAWSFANAEDDCGFNGDGTSTYGGFVGLKSALAAGSTYDAASGNTAFSTLDLADFHGCKAQVKHYAGFRPAWYISREGFSDSMERLMAAGGGNAIMDLEAGARPFFLGSPVIFTQVLPTTLDAQVSTIVAYYGDLNLSSTFGSRRGLNIASDSSVYFTTDQIGVRATQRIAINNHEQGTASAAGPIVALKTPAS